MVELLYVFLFHRFVVLFFQIPTMAIERVNIYDNTSIIQDEVLAHRLGLLPVYADPDDFTFMWESEGESTPENTIALALDVQCRARPGAPETAMPIDRFINSNVYTKDLRWVPLGDQVFGFFFYQNNVSWFQTFSVSLRTERAIRRRTDSHGARRHLGGQTATGSARGD
jgi:hypothetical protein